MDTISFLKFPVASNLNMEYISETEPFGTVFQMIVYNKTVDLLKMMGYKYIYFGSWYDSGRYNMKDNADLYFNFFKLGITSLGTEFMLLLWDTTLLGPFYFYFDLEKYIDPDEKRHAVLDILEHLKKIPDIDGPKFVFAHITSPHYPFLFGPNGEFIG